MKINSSSESAARLNLENRAGLPWVGQLVALFAVLSFVRAAGQPQLQTVYPFGVVNNSGTYPAAPLVAGPDGAFYGTTESGGAYGEGTIFRITTNGSFALLYSFGQIRDTNQAPVDGLTCAEPLTLGPDGALYGTTMGGGLKHVGNIFRITTNAVFTALYAFTNGTDGSTPSGLALGADGNFYGTTCYGAANGGGGAFKVSPQGTLTMLYPFPGGTNGPANPQGLTAGGDGWFYGMILDTGFDWATATEGPGTIFKMDPNGNVVYIHNFSGPDGYFPSGVMVWWDGYLYGVAEGHNGSPETLFKISTNGAFSVLATGNSVAGGFSLGVQAAPSGYGRIYGTASQGIIEISATGALTLISSFANDGTLGKTNTFGSTYGLTLGPDGNFYGIMGYGGTNSLPAQPTFGAGSIFKFSPGVGVRPFYSLEGGPPGACPQGRLAFGPDGNLYGTLTFKGVGGEPMGSGGGYGGIFRLAPTWSYTWLYQFTNGMDGGNPTAGLTLGSDGSFYGVTTNGGLYETNGTAFKVTTDGLLTALYSFTGGADGGCPMGELAADVSGTFYGTTVVGGTSGFGTVFSITTKGALTPIYSFSGRADGGWPYAGLTLGPDGNFYGVTTWGGAANDGTVFQIRTNGALKTLHSFTGSDGAIPVGALALANDGNFYGTTIQGGTYDGGAIFRIGTTGDYALLFSFVPGALGPTGMTPLGQLVQGPDGAFYGVACQGGLSGDQGWHVVGWQGDGTLFRITAAGNFSVLYSFGAFLAMDGVGDFFGPLPGDGANPYGGMITGPGGALYGTTLIGGPGDNGTVFRLTLPPPAPPVLQSVTKSGAAITLTWSADWGVQYLLQYKDDLNAPNWLNLGPILTTTNASITASDTGASSQRFYRVCIPW